MILHWLQISLELQQEFVSGCERFLAQTLHESLSRMQDCHVRSLDLTDHLPSSALVSAAFPCKKKPPRFSLKDLKSNNKERVDCSFCQVLVLPSFNNFSVLHMIFLSQLQASLRDVASQVELAVASATVLLEKLQEMQVGMTRVLLSQVVDYHDL